MHSPGDGFVFEHSVHVVQTTADATPTEHVQPIGGTKARPHKIHIVNVQVEDGPTTLGVVFEKVTPPRRDGSDAFKARLSHVPPLPGAQTIPEEGPLGPKTHAHGRPRHHIWSRGTRSRHPRGFGAVERERLLHQQMPTRLQHRHRQIRMEDRGGRHHHGVDVVAGQKIGGRGMDRHVAGKYKFFLGVQIAFGTRLLRKVGIGHRHQRGAGVTVKRLGMSPSHQSKANHANTHGRHECRCYRLPHRTTLRRWQFQKGRMIFV